MLDPTHQKRIGGTSSHIGDCYIWAEIHYLDSSTSYREYLPPSGAKLVPPDSKLVMLDDQRSTLPGIVISVFVSCLVLALCAVLILWGWWAQ